MKNLEVVIGIEVHTALNTKTKMFSPALNTHIGAPNTCVHPIDLALPGTLPIVNIAAVHKAIILADSLNMEINHKRIEFDRKNYFYSDLPKGYQITQQYFPIGTNGNIKIKDINNNDKEIIIQRIHMEEDTAKQFTKNNLKYIDYNRAGSPLIEIVTDPCISSSFEAMQYLEELKKILIFKDISDAKMEEGSLRADVNISLRPYGCKTLGEKVEIKNINSITNVGKAIDFEIKRQTEIICLNKIVEQETRRFDDTNNTTIFMRKKSNQVDYRYITEPDILCFAIKDSIVKELLKNSLPSPKAVKKILLNDGLDENQIKHLLDNYELYKIFIYFKKKINDVNLIFNWLTVELVGLCKKMNISIFNLNSEYLENITNLLILLKNQEINSKQSKILIEEIIKSNTPVKTLIKKLSFEQITDKNILTNIINKHIKENQDLVSQYKERPERVEKFIVGMVMKETNSQANPKITIDLVRYFLNL